MSVAVVVVARIREIAIVPRAVVTVDVLRPSDPGKSAFVNSLQGSIVYKNFTGNLAAVINFYTNVTKLCDFLWD